MNEVSAYLDEPGIICSYNQLSILSYVPTACDILKSRDSFCHLLCTRRVDLHSCGCSDCIAVWFGGGEVNGGDGGVLLDKDGVFELPPVSALCAVVCGGRLGVFLYDDGLVVHRFQRQLFAATGACVARRTSRRT